MVKRLVELGLGSRPIPMTRLTDDRIYRSPDGAISQGQGHALR